MFRERVSERGLAEIIVSETLPHTTYGLSPHTLGICNLLLLSIKGNVSMFRVLKRGLSGPGPSLGTLLNTP